MHHYYQNKIQGNTNSVTRKGGNCDGLQLEATRCFASRDLRFNYEAPNESAYKFNNSTWDDTAIDEHIWLNLYGACAETAIFKLPVTF